MLARLTADAEANIIVAEHRKFTKGDGLMQRKTITSQRLIVIFVIGCLLLNYPLVSIVNQSRLLAGIPLLFLFIFGVWLLLILLTAIVLRRKE